MVANGKLTEARLRQIPNKTGCAGSEAASGETQSSRNLAAVARLVRRLG